METIELKNDIHQIVNKINDKSVLQAIKILLYKIPSVKEKIPNKVTKKAIIEARQKKGEKFNNTKDLLNELNA